MLEGSTGNVMLLNGRDGVAEGKTQVLQRQLPLALEAPESHPAKVATEPLADA